MSDVLLIAFPAACFTACSTVCELDGPSKTIIVEPIEPPVIEPVTEPAPEPEPVEVPA